MEELQDFLYYITLNGYLRVIPLIKKEPFEYDDTQNQQDYVCTISEKYLVTGLYLGGQIVNPSNGWNLIEAGLKPIEPFLFVASNKLFLIQESEYRLENEQFVLSFLVPK